MLSSMAMKSFSSMAILLLSIYLFINQSLKFKPKGKCKVGGQKSTWQRELKKDINKTLSKALTVAASKEKKNGKTMCVAYALHRDNWQ